jgi:hypothetical protein
VVGFQSIILLHIYKSGLCAFAKSLWTSVSKGVPLKYQDLKRWGFFMEEDKAVFFCMRD